MSCGEEGEEGEDSISVKTERTEGKLRLRRARSLPPLPSIGREAMAASREMRSLTPGMRVTEEFRWVRNFLIFNWWEGFKELKGTSAAEAMRLVGADFLGIVDQWSNWNKKSVRTLFG